MGTESESAEATAVTAHNARREQGHVPALIAIGVVASLLGILFGILIDWFPTAASEEAGPIDTLWDVLVIVSVPVFVLVTTVVLYCVWRFKMQPGEEELDGPPTHGNTRLEIIWTAIPAILLVALCSYAYVVLTDIEEASADPALEVRVVGEQFTWTFFYENPDGSGEQVASPQLYVPLGQQVHFTVQSKDVLHDFWVPAFRMKIDAVRGVNTELRVTPKKLGDYPVVCAELCGLGHSAMRQTAHVVRPDEFDSWLDERAQQAAGGEQEEAGGAAGGEEGGSAENGAAVFTGQGCGGCHALADAGTTGGTGPDLDESLAGKDEAYIEEGIVNPSAVIAEGYQDGIMPPSYGTSLTPAELDSLVKYLAEVTK
jgi:cytochrome c oxidase subunit 2